MTLLWALLLLVQSEATKPSAASDARIRALAERGSLISSRLDNAILQDPEMRAQWRRVGFETGCLTFAAVEKEVKARHVPDLVEPTIAAIRKYVPQERLDRMPALSFSYGGLQVYRARIENELNRTSASLFARAVQDMRRAYGERVRALPTTSNPADNIVMPKADLAVALGIKGAWDLDNAAHLGMACAELQIPPQIRPTITTGPQGPFTIEVKRPAGAKQNDD